MNDETRLDESTPPRPDAALRRLDRLVGTWRISGGAAGQVRYEWMNGGYFLIQYVDLEVAEGGGGGIEMIGRERGYGADAPSDDIKSRYYGERGDTLDYVYELEGDTLTIWFGERGSPAFYSGTFGDNDMTLTGAWSYPGGGGYSTTATRVEESS